MIPFPGESVGLDDCYGVAYGSVAYRGGMGGDPPSATLSTGEEWRAWVYDGSAVQLDEDSADVVVSWVVETLVGSSGSFAASMGLDPVYGDTGAAHPVDLGTHVVSGAATVVIPTTLTAADVRSGGAAMMLVLEGVSGDVVVQQIKLRVWPPGGPSGAWVEQAPWTEPNYSRGRYGEASPTPLVIANVDGADTAEADGNLSLGLAMYPATVEQVGPIDLLTPFTGYPAMMGMGTLRTTLMSAAPLQVGASATMSMSVGVYWLPELTNEALGSNSIDYDALTWETDFIVPPEEVYSDHSSWTQLLGDAYADTPSATRTLTASQSTNIGADVGAYVHVVSGDLPVDATSYPFNPQIAQDGSVFWPIGGDPVAVTFGDGQSADYGVTIPPISTGQAVYVFVGFSGIRPPGKPSMADWNPSGIADVYCNVEYYLDVTGIAGTFHHPAYRVWNPTALPEPEWDDTPPAGYFLTPNPNLDGLGDGVDVNFA